jgi:hypothetical protein
MFKSESRAGLRAFAGDSRGTKLPPNHGPWTQIGVVDSNKAPPHNFPRAAIEKAIATTGFQLWRVKSEAAPTPAARPAAPAAKRPAAAPAKGATTAKRPATAPAKHPAAAPAKRPVAASTKNATPRRPAPTSTKRRAAHA